MTPERIVSKDESGWAAEVMEGGGERERERERERNSLVLRPLLGGRG